MSVYFYKDQLKSERLTTRYLTANDISIWARFFEDPEATEFLYLDSLGLSGHIEVATHMIQKQIHRYANQKYGLQVLINNHTQEFIGLCGLLLQQVEGADEIEIGYHIFKQYWGNGFATEAAKMFAEFAFSEDIAESVISIIDIKNYKSQRVAEKNGFHREKQTTWLDDEKVFIYRLMQP